MDFLQSSSFERWLLSQREKARRSAKEYAWAAKYDSWSKCSTSTSLLFLLIIPEGNFRLILPFESHLFALSDQMTRDKRSDWFLDKLSSANKFLKLIFLAQ